MIVSGAATGQPVDSDELLDVHRTVAGRAPLFIGSGVAADNINSLRPYASGLIIGSSLKRDSRPENSVDPACVRALLCR